MKTLQDLMNALPTLIPDILAAIEGFRSLFTTHSTAIANNTAAVADLHARVAAIESHPAIATPIAPIAPPSSGAGAD